VHTVAYEADLQSARVAMIQQNPMTVLKALRPNISYDGQMIAYGGLSGDSLSTPSW